jgi:hypothetical protein
MTYAIPTNAQLLVDQYNLSGYLKGIDPEMVVEMADSTVLGDTGRKGVPTLVSGGIGFEALYDRTTGSAFDVIRTALQSASQQIVTSFPEGSTLGYPCDLCYANTVKFGTPIKVADLIGVVGYFKSEEDGVDSGVSLQALTAVTATGNGTSVDNAAASTNGGVVVLHTTAIAGASPSVTWKLQHSTDNSSFTDVSGGTFTAQTAVGAQRLELTGTINRYTRAVRTFGGTTTSITSAVALARR